MRNLVAIAMLVYSGVTTAQDCENLIKLSREYSKTTLSQKTFSENINNFCKEYSKSHLNGSSINASASYKAISGAYGKQNISAKQLAEKYCSDNSSVRDKSEAFMQYIDDINPRAYESYNQCIGMQKEIKFKVPDSFKNPNEFKMAVSYLPEGHSSAQLEIDASQGVDCKWSASKNTSYTFTKAGTENFTCTRTKSDKEDLIMIIRKNGQQTLNIPWIAFDEEGNAANTVNDIQTKLRNLELSLQGAVVAFNSISCPDGWEPYDKAYGRFIRGIDYGHPVKSDPEGERKPGSLQEDSLKKHTHTHIAPRAYDSGPGSGHTRTKIASTPGTTSETGEDETRPKNVALLYCEKK